MTLPDPPGLNGETTRLITPDFTPEIVGGAYAEFDEYRCFAVELPNDSDVFLTGYSVFPGNEAIVHHVIGMPVDWDALGWAGSQTNQELIEAMSSSDREGWPCFEGAGAGVSFSGEVVSWAPGQGAVEYPSGAGVRLPAGTRMVFQVHYNLVDPDVRGQSDQTAIDLRLESSVEREAFVTLPDLFLGGEASVTEIPPGEAAASVSFDLPFEWLISVPLELELIGVLPHMHERGRQMSVSIDHANGSQSCVAEVHNWDFEWQRMYFYENPIRFHTDDVLKVECIYDTSSETSPVLPGWGTQNEMCLPGLVVTIAR